MGSRQNILNIALDLAKKRSIDKISYAEIAEIAGVHWTTVRRHLGNKQEMRALLAEHLAKQGEAPVHTDTRTKVLEAAKRIFAKHGFAGATLDQVAADAGMTKGAVYWHYSSKNDLYLALCEHNLSQQTKLIPMEAEGILNSSDPIQAIAAWLRSQFQECLEGPEQAMLFFEFLVSSRDPEIRQRLSSAFEELYQQVARMFEALQSKGQLRQNIAPKAMAVYIQSLLHGLLVTWLINPREADLDSMTEDLAQLLWNGFYSEDHE